MRYLARCSSRSSVSRATTSLCSAAAAFRAAMDEDFNSPAAVAVQFELVGEANRSQSPALARQLAELAGVLGIVLPDAVADPAAAVIQAKVDARSAARAWSWIPGTPSAGSPEMRVTVVGSGYVGLVAGACFAETGNDVVCVDNDAAKVERLRRNGHD